jgi:hypothetical protein
MSRLPLLFVFVLATFVTTNANDRDSQPAKPNVTNPTVAPGKIRWHSTFSEACQASAKSGKPVLLFQMLGKLDQEFC